MHEFSIQETTMRTLKASGLDVVLGQKEMRGHSVKSSRLIPSVTVDLPRNSLGTTYHTIQPTRDVSGTQTRQKIREP